MSVPESSEVAKKKEFLQFKKQLRDKEGPDTDVGPSLKFSTYQKFVSHFVNPRTTHSKLLMKHGTGVGKTLGSLAVAMQYIDHLRREKVTKNLKDFPGSVFIIGFSKPVFQKELLLHGHFGFVTEADKDKLKLMSKDDRQEFLATLKRRLSNRKGNGAFRFMGYKELFNKLFDFTKLRQLDPDLVIGSLNEQEILTYVQENKIEINVRLLNSFAHSLVICDEIHNVYNSLEKNSWGIALQYIFNTHAPNIKAVFLSATPINNSPLEVIDLLNLLSDENKYHKSDFFKSDNKTLLPNALKKLGEELRGKVSFVVDKDVTEYPSRVLVGEEIPEIDYLKFERCYMSKYHRDQYVGACETIFSTENQHVLDFIIPDITDIQSQNDSSPVVSFSTVLSFVSTQPPEWRNKHGIHLTDDNIITGDILKTANLKTYSAKYHKMITSIREVLSGKKNGKIFIYHNYVYSTGVLFIKEILLQNGLIEPGMTSTNDTLCANCGKTKKESHSGHDFVATKFVMAHGELDKRTVTDHIDLFNREDNLDGGVVKVLVGSKMLKESYNLKAVRHLFVMSRPDNISTLIQIMGRAIRKGSHSALPIESRNVFVRIFVTSYPPEYRQRLEPGSKLSCEEIKYQEKVEDYKVIQKIERELNRHAVDVYINKEVILNALSSRGLGELEFGLPEIKPEKEIDTRTFDAYYRDEQLKEVLILIKNLFVNVSKVWKVDDLFEAVKNPPFKVELYSKMVDRDMFDMAIHILIDPNPNSLSYIARDLYSKFIIHDRSFSMVKAYGPYLVLEHEGVPSFDIFSDNWDRTNFKDRHITVNINKFIQQRFNLFSKNYTQTQILFKDRYDHLDIIDMADAITDFGTEFQIKFIEEMIEFVFDFYTNPVVPNSSFRDFYFKMLYYYDSLGLILFANKVRGYSILTDMYKAFTKNESKFKTKAHSDSLSGSCIATWCPEETIETYRINLTETMKIVDTVDKQTKSTDNKPNRIYSDLLPIGHLGEVTPKFYDPYKKEWFYSEQFGFNNTNIPENDFIVGFNEKSDTALTLQFKLRSPAHKIVKHKDARQTEKSSSCINLSKSRLEEIAKKLDSIMAKKSESFSRIPTGLTKKEYCVEIKKRLMELQNIEGDKVRWFYQFYERQPTI